MAPQGCPQKGPLAGPQPQASTHWRARPLPHCSVTAQEEELRERIASSEGAQVYAKHLERKGARVPQYLQKAVRPPSRTAGRS